MSNRFVRAGLAILLLCLAGTLRAGTFAHINVNGDFSDWTNEMIVAEDPQNDQTTGSLDIKRVYMANDSDYIYMRVEAWGPSTAWDPYGPPNMTMWFDADNNAATGFNPFGTGVVGAEAMYALELYSEGDGGYNDGWITGITAAPALWPATAQSSWEFRFPRAAKHPASLAGARANQPVFGADGTTLSLMVVSDTSGPRDQVPNDALAAHKVAYRLAAPSEGAIPSVYKKITIDGDVGDWPAEAEIALDPQNDSASGFADFKSVWIANDENFVYFRFDTWASVTPWANGGGATMWIDTDHNLATGFNPYTANLVGAELMYAHSLYSEADGGYNDGAIGSVTCAPGIDTAGTHWEFKLPRSATHPSGLSSPLAGQPIFQGDGSVLSVLWSAGGTPNDLLPNGVGTPVEYKLAAAPADTDVSVFNRITIDGDMSDWTEASLVYQDLQGDIGGGPIDLRRLYLANDDNYLYVRVDGWTPTVPWVNGGGLTLFFDTDVNAATGFDPYGAGIVGSEFMWVNLLVSQAAGSYNEGIIGDIDIAPALTASGTSWEARIRRDIKHPWSATLPTSEQPVFGGTGSRLSVLAANTTGGSPDLMPETAPDRVSYRFAENPDPALALTYTVPLIDRSQAPNVQDSTFDAIYANGGAHPAIAGNDWKDWSQRDVDANLAIGEPYASTSKAYLLTDGQYLYFGMLVYDPNTAQMTSDVGDDTGAKWGVESIEVTFAAQSGAAGAVDAATFASDAFGHIDDMLPNANVGPNTTARTYSNSYVINSTTWAVEWRVGLDELIGNTELLHPLPAPTHAQPLWYGNVGYQSPVPDTTPRVPFYAAAHGNGFQDFHVQWDLSNLVPNAVDGNWTSYE